MSIFTKHHIEASSEHDDEVKERKVKAEAEAVAVARRCLALMALA